MATKKLLHERLRNYIQSGPDRTLEINGNSFAMGNFLAGSIVDEIERYYIPRPCDDEGRPWRIGDPVIALNRGETTVTGLAWDGEEWLLRCRWGGRDNEISDFVRQCKRPIKVLDADGVPIKVGDTVWHVETGKKFLVVGLPKPGSYCSVEVESMEPPRYRTSYDPDLLTYEEPDSLLKVRDSLGSHYDEGEYGKIPEDINRLTALIERGA